MFRAAKSWVWIVCAVLVACSPPSDEAAVAPRAVERAQETSGVGASLAALDYGALGAPEGTASVHARVFAQFVSEQPSAEELKELASGAEVVAFIAAHALSMHDRLWAVRVMRELPSPAGRLLLLDWVNEEATYPRLRCLSVRAMSAFNLVTDDEVRSAVVAASESDDACVREAAQALIEG